MSFTGLLLVQVVLMQYMHTFLHFWPCFEFRLLSYLVIMMMKMLDVFQVNIDYHIHTHL